MQLDINPSLQYSTLLKKLITDMLDKGLRKNSQIANSKSQLSIAPTADEFYKRDVKKESEDELLQFLCFIADDEEYALELDEIKEVIKVRGITDVPHAHDFIIGIISLRGEIISVINLARRLGLKERGVSPETRMLILSHTDVKVCFIVDRIMGVVRINPKEIESALSMQKEASDEFIRGVVHYQDRFIILLNLPALLKFEET